MRFILNFFIFGFIFYLIYLFFPEAFNTLVSWASQVYNFFHDIFIRISERFSSTTHEPEKQAQVIDFLFRKF